MPNYDLQVLNPSPKEAPLTFMPEDALVVISEIYVLYEAITNTTVSCHLLTFDNMDLFCRLHMVSHYCNVLSQFESISSEFSSDVTFQHQNQHQFWTLQHDLQRKGKYCKRKHKSHIKLHVSICTSRHKITKWSYACQQQFLGYCLIASSKITEN